MATTVGTKFAPPSARICMDEVEIDFLKTEELQSLVWFQYIDDKFFLYGIIERINFTNF